MPGSLSPHCKCLSHMTLAQYLHDVVHVRDGDPISIPRRGGLAFGKFAIVIGEMMEGIDDIVAVARILAGGVAHYSYYYLDMIVCCRLPVIEIESE